MFAFRRCRPCCANTGGAKRESARRRVLADRRRTRRPTGRAAMPTRISETTAKRADNAAATSNNGALPDAAAPRKRNGHPRNGHRRDAIAAELPPTMMNAVGAAVPVTEWDRLSADSRTEIEHLLEVLKAVKQG